MIYTSIGVSLFHPGKIHLRHLSISGSKYGNGEVHVDEGQSVEWSVPNKKADKDVKELLAELKR